MPEFEINTQNGFYLFTETGMYQVKPGERISVAVGPGQPMLTVKDDYEDHEAAIRSLKACLAEAREVTYARLFALLDRFSRRNLR